MTPPIPVLAQQVSPPNPSPWPPALFVVGIAALLWAMYWRAYGGRRTSSTAPTDRHDGGSVYVLSNSGYDDLVKVGYTTRDATTRAEELSANAAVPGDFEVEHETEVGNPESVEQAVHDRLAAHKVNEDREFFEVGSDEAQQAIERAIGPEASIMRRGLGVLLCGLGVLVTLALVTYSPADNEVVQSVSVLEAVMHLGSESTLPLVQNMLGPFGAWLARALIPEFLGYLVLVPSGLVALCGYTLTRGRSLHPLRVPMVLVLLGTLIAAVTIGGAGHALQSGPVGWAGTPPQSSGIVHWAGTTGLDLADWLRAEVGALGSLALLGTAAGGCVALSVVWGRQQNGRR